MSTMRSGRSGWFPAALAAALLAIGAAGCPEEEPVVEDDPGVEDEAPDNDNGVY
jgi:hypothetical protein